jgi:hypothetical protein
MLGSRRHMWFVMESQNYRLTKSFSDLNSTDPYIHGGTIDGVFREMGNALVRKDRQPNVLQMWAIYRKVRGKTTAILRACDAQTVFQARAFEELSFAANLAAGEIVR